jgi:superfamily I DNA and/or RNA helicase
VVKEAKVLGATCTKAYLAVKEVGQFDMVIVDEASMVVLPMLWFVAGLAKARVVVCGDFCQIPANRPDGAAVRVRRSRA